MLSLHLVVIRAEAAQRLPARVVHLDDVDRPMLQASLDHLHHTLWHLNRHDLGNRGGQNLCCLIK
jgi:hypothetical protein